MWRNEFKRLLNKGQGQSFWYQSILRNATSYRLSIVTFARTRRLATIRYIPYSQTTTYGRNTVVFRHRTWPTTAVLSPMLVSGGCVPQRAEHVSWRGHTAPLATERSRLLDPEVPDYGTVFRCTWKTLTSYNEIPAVVRHFCLDSARGHGAVWNLLTAPTRKFVLTYLLTYLLTV